MNKKSNGGYTRKTDAKKASSGTNKARAQKLDRIEMKDKEIREYNAEHGTNYSYGEYTALIRMGKIKTKGE